MKKKAVIIFSGGQDSTTCLAIAKQKGYECFALTFDYGQKHKYEIEAAKKIANQFNVNHKIIDVKAIGELGGSALTDSDLSVENQKNLKSKTVPSTYVPARNTVFLSIALAYAEVINANCIYIGVAKDDHMYYPDGRPSFISAFQSVINEGTKSSMEGGEGIEVITPLMNMSKSEMIVKGLGLGINYYDTVTCYNLTENGLACGDCHSCYLRKQGFESAGVEDQTNYQYV